MFNYLALYKWTLSVLNEFSFPFVLNGLTIHALFNVADIMQDVIAECIHMWHWHNIQWAHVAIIFVFSSSNQLHRNTVNYVVSNYLSFDIFCIISSCHLVYVYMYDILEPRPTLLIIQFLTIHYREQFTIY